MMMMMIKVLPFFFNLIMKIDSCFFLYHFHFFIIIFPNSDEPYNCWVNLMMEK